MKNTDERLQMPVYWGELDDDAQEYLALRLSERWGFRIREVREVLAEMDRNSQQIGFIMIQEYDIKKVLDEL